MGKVERAYSLLTVKSLDDEQRILSGTATTPTPDRMADVVEPLGVKVAPDIPLFLYHDSRLTVGRAQLGKPTKDGIPFRASLPNVIEPGTVQDRVNEAWHSLKYKLITGVSIGFQPIETERLPSGGARFVKSEILELSLVPIPANAEATIATVKEYAGQSHAPERTDKGEWPALAKFKAAWEAEDLEQMVSLFNDKALDKEVLEIAAKSGHKHVNDQWRSVIEKANGERKPVQYTEDVHDAVFLLLKAAFRDIAALSIQVQQRASIGAIRRKQAGHLEYKGVFKSGQTYQRGDFTTYGGNLWHCNTQTADAPPGEAWTLAVRRGQDGKDAR